VESEKVDGPDDRWIDPSAIEERLRKQEELRVRTETRALPMATASMETVRDLLGAPNRHSNASTAEVSTPVAQPAPGQRDAESASRSDQLNRETDSGNESTVGRVTDEAKDSGNGVQSDGGDDLDPSGSEANTNGTEPTAPRGKNGSESKPGPTSVPKRFKVN